MADAASQTGDADSSRAPGLTSGFQESTVVLYCWCHSDIASVLLYFTFLYQLFPLPCRTGSTVPRERFDWSVIMHFSWCVVAVTLLYSIGSHQCQACIYTLSLCRGHSWRVRIAKQETGATDSSRAPGLTSGLQGSVNVHRGALLLVPQWQCIRVFLYFTFMLYENPGTYQTMRMSA